MRPLTVTLGLIALAVCGSLGGGAPLQGRVLALQETVPASAANDYVYTFKAREPANITVSGNGASYLGLYVFDQFGNCVARDEGATPNTCDDLAVEWYPAEVGQFTIEVKSLGQLTNAYAMAIR